MNWRFKYLFRIQGFPIVDALAEFENIKREDPLTRVSRQEAKAWRIFDHHRVYNQLYQKFLGDGAINSWEEIPILSKRDIQASLDDRLTPPYTKKSVFINNTSGSSGTPFVFAKDKFCHSMCWATINDRFGQHGIKIGEHLQARFYGIPSSGFGFFKETLKDLLARRIRIPVFDLSEKKLGDILRVFEKREFHYVNGYTSSLVLFAKFLIKEG